MGRHGSFDFTLPKRVSCIQLFTSLLLGERAMRNLLLYLAAVVVFLMAFGFSGTDENRGQTKTQILSPCCR